MFSPLRQGPQITNFKVELVLYLENESEMVVLHVVSDRRTVFKGDLEILLEEVYMLVLLAFLKRNVTLCGA